MTGASRMRTEEQLLADWKAFLRLLVRTAPDHPSRPYLFEAVRRTEDSQIIARA